MNSLVCKLTSERASTLKTSQVLLLRALVVAVVVGVPVAEGGHGGELVGAAVAQMHGVQ